MIPGASLRAKLPGNTQLAEILRASGMIIGARVLATLVALITGILVARWFGKEAMGFMALVSSVTVVFASLSTFGLGTFVMRSFSASELTENAPEKASLFAETRRTVITMTCIMAVPTLAIIHFRLPEFAQSIPLWAMAIAAMALIGRVLVLLNVDISRAVASTPLYAAFLMGPGFGSLIVVVLSRLSGTQTQIIPTLAMAIGLVVTGFLALWFILRRLRQASAEVNAAPQVRHRSRIRMLRLGLPFAISSIAAMLVTEGNVMVAGLFLPVDDLGVYAVAQRVSMLTVFVLTSVTLLVAPRFSRLSTKGEIAKMKSYGQTVSAVIFWTTAPLVVVILLASETIIRATFGMEFIAAAPVLTIMMVGQIVNAATGVTDPFLNMTHGHKVLAAIVTTAAALNLGLTLLLTPVLGLTGPAIAMSTSIAFWNFAALIAIRLRDGIWLCYVPRIFSRKRDRAA